METLRFQVVGEAFRKRPLEVKAPDERPAKYFGRKVFNREKMYKYLPKDVYEKMMEVMDNGARLDRDIADAVAEGMKQWATDWQNGVPKYRALVLGQFQKNEGTLNAFIAKDARRGAVKVLHRDAPGAKPICTRYRVAGQRGSELYEVILEPVTGRTHQLRAHMADFGHPLLGDDRYGDRAANRRYSGLKLCLWHERLTVSADSPLTDYRGRVFEAEAPEWGQF